MTQRTLTPVTDPELLRELNASEALPRRVTDPALLQELERGPWDRYKRPEQAAGPWTKYAPAPTQQPAQGLVDAMRQQSPSTNVEDTTQPGAVGQWMQGVDDRMRSVARGLPVVGPYMDEASAAMNAVPTSAFAGQAAQAQVPDLIADAVGGQQAVEKARGQLRGLQSEYEQNLSQERERDKAFDAAHPYQSMTGQGIGMVGGTLAALPALAARIPTTMGGKMFAGGVVGGGLGAVEGFGRGEGVQSRIGEAKHGARVGAAFGTAAAPVALASGKVAKWGWEGWRKLGNMFTRKPPEVRKAMTNIAKALETQGLSPDDAATRLRELGKPGMIADLNEGMQVYTGAKASQDLGAAKTIGERLTARNEGAGQRVANILDDTFGRPIDPYARQQATKFSARAVGQGYDKVYDQVVPYTFELEALSKRIPASAINRANELMRVEGVTSKQILAKIGKNGQVQSFKRVPDMRQWDYIQRGIRELAEGQDGRGMTGGTNSLGRALQNLRSDLMGHLDKASPDFKALRKSYADVAEVQRAYETGLKDVLRKREMTPSRRAAEQAQRSVPARKALVQGVRTDLDMSLSNARQSPSLTADRLLTRDWNDQKMKALLGRGRAEDLTRRIGAEETFLDTMRTASPGVKGGSRTAMIQGAQEMPKAIGAFTEPLGTGALATAVTGNPAVGAGAYATQVSGKLLSQGKKALAERTMKAITRAEASMLTASGAERDAIVKELGKVAAQLRKAGLVEDATKLFTYAAMVAGGNRARVPEPTLQHLSR